MARQGGESGQASVELIAAIPALVLVTLLVAQLVLAGYALWSAGVAARAGARAAYVGGDAGRAARASLPEALRKNTSVIDGDGVQVRIRAPSVLPGLPHFPVSARAGLGVGDGGGQ
jgi:pilus assembly protein CpaE